MIKILIADDRRLNRLLLTTLLAGSGYEVIEAEDGSEALSLARERRPDLIITDLLMPVMGGVELVREIRSDAELSGTPCVFYSAVVDSADLWAFSTALHVPPVLFKPSEPEAILAVVRGLVQENRNGSGV